MAAVETMADGGVATLGRRLAQVRVGGDTLDMGIAADAEGTCGDEEMAGRSRRWQLCSRRREPVLAEVWRELARGGSAVKGDPHR